MGKFGKIFFGVVVVAVIVAVVASPLVLGLFGQTDSTNGNQDKSEGSPSAPSDPSATPEVFEDVDGSELKERVDQDPSNIYEGRYTGPGAAPQYFEPMEEAPHGNPPGVNRYLDHSDLQENTIARASEESFVFNVYISGSDYDGPDFFGTKYDAQKQRGESTLVYTNEQHLRQYWEQDAAMEQNVTFKNQREDIFVENQTISSPSAQDYLRFNRLKPFLMPGAFEPINYTMVNGHQVTVMQAAFSDAEGEQVLIDYLDDAVEIKGYGGEIHLDEHGSLLEASVTVVYETVDGNEEVIVVNAEMIYGDVNVSKPSWASEEALYQPSSDVVEMVENQYIRIQPESESIPEGSTLELSTATDQWAVTMPHVEVGETVYISIQENQLNITTSPPDPEEYIGVDYSVLIVDTEGELIISEEN